LSFPPLKAIYLAIRILSISYFCMSNIQYGHIYNILFFVYRFIFCKPNSNTNYRFIRFSNFSSFLMLIYVWHLNLDIQHVFLVFNWFFHLFTECFKLPKMTILCTYLFTYFLDKFQLVWYYFSGQFFIDLVTFFQYYHLYLEEYFFLKRWGNYHIFQIFIRFRLIFVFT